MSRDSTLLFWEYICYLTKVRSILVSYFIHVKNTHWNNSVTEVTLLHIGKIEFFESKYQVSWFTIAFLEFWAKKRMKIDQRDKV